MSPLPSFTPDGVLPAGDYSLTLAELRASALVVGPGGGFADWDSNWRARLVDNLEILVMQLWQAGLSEIFINGSFVEDKEHPNDIDGYFVCDFEDFYTGALAARLNDLDPHRIWSWDPQERRSYRGYAKRQLPMWHQYRVEFYPHASGITAGRDQFGNELEFPAIFRQPRRALPSGDPQKGIVKIAR